MDSDKAIKVWGRDKAAERWGIGVDPKMIDLNSVRVDFGIVDDNGYEDSLYEPAYIEVTISFRAAEDFIRTYERQTGWTTKVEDNEMAVKGRPYSVRFPWYDISGGSFTSLIRDITDYAGGIIDNSKNDE